MVIEKSKKKNSKLLLRIWKYFEKGGSKNEAVCKTCAAVVAFNKPSMAEMTLHIVRWIIYSFSSY